MKQKPHLYKALHVTKVGKLFGTGHVIPEASRSTFVRQHN